ncbi:hypothetical protein [Lentzea sp. NEAU-D7]|uniref:hypothetical protein n=1 Tax=Lentzea sp. NEAU-D7 TaxID=2994667 RepID=UPI00224A95CC|nr:hypothetical protein [Lentzea sp. NEAU-D7]MCX2953699.1 hypothetical protein [Lentzea sp. NEAU-D7]
MGSERAAGREPSELGIEMLPVAVAGLRAELSEARALARELAGMTPAQADSSWCDQLEDEYHDVGAGHRQMVRQLTRWRLDHPDAPGLDELADLVAEVEPVCHDLLRQLARLRCARGTSGTRVPQDRPRATLIRDEPQWTFSDSRHCGPRALHVWREDDTHLVAVVVAESPEGGVNTADAGDAVAARLRAEHPDCEIELLVWTPSPVPGGGDRFERVHPSAAGQVVAHDVIDRLGAGQRYRCRCQS